MQTATTAAKVKGPVTFRTAARTLISFFLGLQLADQQDHDRSLNGL
jgi:hypothetical protein